MITPILFLGDSPDLRTGLARIGRDLSCLTSSLPEFRVGFSGRGGHGSRQLPFVQYNFDETYQWGEALIERVWQDFAGTEKGIIFSIWDASRLHWFGSPRQEALPVNLYRFLTSGRFSRWGYFPIDSHGPNGKLSVLSSAALKGYDRKLAYTHFGAKILESDYIPHGINTSTFQPRGRTAGRMTLGFGENDVVVGCCMTNQVRKDWGLAFATMSELHRQNQAVRFWCHVDVLQRSHAWNIQALIADYNAYDWIKVTYDTPYSDTEMSYLYSACDLTILPTLGEGFGYPVVESLSCGVPVVTGEFGGQAELIPNKDWLVGVSNWRVEGLGNSLRPIYNPEDFVEVILETLEEKPEPEYCRASVEHLDWKNLWFPWKRWILEGLK